MQLDPGLLVAIIERPDDDLPRLMLADWLQERGEEARAEFIRVQCRLARITHSALCRDGCGCEVGDLCRRERELLATDHPFQSSVAVASFAWLPLPVRIAHNHWHESSVRPTTPVFRRGFVEEITCSWQDWQRHAAAIRAATPIRVVRLTTWPEEMDNRHRQRGIPQIVQKNLAVQYPGITFQLPQQTNAYGITARTTIRQGQYVYMNPDGSVG